MVTIKITDKNQAYHYGDVYPDFEKVDWFTEPAYKGKDRDGVPVIFLEDEIEIL